MIEALLGGWALGCSCGSALSCPCPPAPCSELDCVSHCCSHTSRCGSAWIHVCAPVAWFSCCMVCRCCFSWLLLRTCRWLIACRACVPSRVRRRQGFLPRGWPVEDAARLPARLTCGACVAPAVQWRRFQLLPLLPGMGGTVCASCPSLMTCYLSVASWAFCRQVCRCPPVEA